MYYIFCYCSLRNVCLYTLMQDVDFRYILGYNGFSAGWIDHPRVWLIIQKKFAFQTIYLMRRILDF